MDAKVEFNIKYLEERIDKAINMINGLREENARLKNILKELQDRNNQSIEKINLLLDNISKLL
jgi:translation initiation factor 1 (eIF-1/SUI1)